MKSLFFMSILSISLSLAAIACQPESPETTPTKPGPAAAPKSTANPSPTPAPSQPARIIPRPTITPKPKSTPGSIAVPSPTVTPTPLPDAAGVLSRLQSDFPEVYLRATNLMVRYPWWALSYSDQTNAHVYTVFAGDKMWEIRWKAEAFANSMAYLSNASSLTKTGKLEMEVQPRNLSPKELIMEIVSACRHALDELDKQIKSTYDSQEYFEKAIKDDLSLLIRGRYTDPVTPEQKQSAILDMNKYYEGYRKDFSELVANIESVIGEAIKITGPRVEVYP